MGFVLFFILIDKIKVDFEWMNTGTVMLFIYEEDGSLS